MVPMVKLSRLQISLCEQLFRTAGVSVKDLPDLQSWAKRPVNWTRQGYGSFATWQIWTVGEWGYLHTQLSARRGDALEPDVVAPLGAPLRAVHGEGQHGVGPVAAQRQLGAGIGVGQ